MNYLHEGDPDKRTFVKCKIFELDRESLSKSLRIRTVFPACDFEAMQL